MIRTIKTEIAIVATYTSVFHIFEKKPKVINHSYIAQCQLQKQLSDLLLRILNLEAAVPRCSSKNVFKNFVSLQWNLRNFKEQLLL